jgi:hypothetical protein
MIAARMVPSENDANVNRVFREFEKHKHKFSDWDLQILKEVVEVEQFVRTCILIDWLMGGD